MEADVYWLACGASGHLRNRLEIILGYQRQCYTHPI